MLPVHRRLARLAAVASFLLAGLATTGCTSLGYQAGVMQMAAEQDPATSFANNLSSLPKTGGGVVHQLSFVDTSGFLMSFLGTLGNQRAARNDAIRDASQRDVKAGEKIEYRYSPVLVPPGGAILYNLRLGFFDYTLNNSSSPLKVQGEGSSSGHWGFDVIGDILQAQLGDAPLWLAGQFALTVNDFSVNAGKDARVFGHTTLDVYAGGRLTWALTERLVAKVSARLGLVTPLMFLILGSPQGGAGFTGIGSADLGFQPTTALPGLTLNANYTFGLEAETVQRLTTHRGTLGLMYSF